MMTKQDQRKLRQSVLLTFVFVALAVILLTIQL